MNMIYKTQSAFLLFLLCSFLAFAQKKFEGKVTYELVLEDASGNNAESGKQTAVFFYNKNSVRFETDENNTAVIYDYERGDQLTLVDISVLDYKQAVLSNIARIDKSKIDKSDETKNILGRKCNKVIFTYSIAGQETKSTGYADFEYKIIIGLDISGNAIYSPLFFEQETKLPEGGAIIQKIVSLEEDFFDEKLFELDYPEGYNFLDERKSLTNETSKPYTPDNDWQYYSKLTTAELETIVTTALPSEDYDTATLIKAIIEKRKKGKFYRSKTIKELQDMITAALSKEDFETAEEMKTEIINRSK